MGEELSGGMDMEITEAESEAAFADGWDSDIEFQAEEPDGESAETAGQAEEKPDGEEERAEGDEDTPEEGEDTPDGEKAEEEAPPADEGQPKTWDLESPGGQKASVSEAQMVELAGMGMDYGRVRAMVDEATPFMQLMVELAQDAGMSLHEYGDWLTAQHMQSKGMSEAEASAAVQRQNDQRSTFADQQRMKAEAERERQQQDLRMFISTFPDAAKDPDNIPKEVWDKVDQGMPLVAAYSQYAVQQAKADAEEAQRKYAAEEQNRKNADRSPGSMRSAGENQSSKDPFLAGWES